MRTMEDPMSEPAARQRLREAREKATAEREAAEEAPESVLERAAMLMRQRAQDAYPGPWISDENDDCWRLHSAPDRRFPTAQILKAPKHGTPYAEYWPDKPTSEHIVSWHPGVALAVADWLDSWAGIEWDPQKYRSGDQEAAWRVAHAYMGFEMRTPLAVPEAAYSDCGCRVGECGAAAKMRVRAER